MESEISEIAQNADRTSKAISAFVLLARGFIFAVFIDWTMETRMFPSIKLNCFHFVDSGVFCLKEKCHMSFRYFPHLMFLNTELFSISIVSCR